MNARSVAVAAALALAAAPREARAVAFDLGERLVLRFDNTLRYNLGIRTDPVNAKIGSNPAFQAGEYKFSQGDVTTNRLDLLSELDVIYDGRFGARVSAAAWYDQAYASGMASGNPALEAQGILGPYVGNRFSDYTRHRYEGLWGEFLDAFAFANLDLLGVPVTLKAGRHALAWGESLMLTGAVHGIAYAQVPLDLQKGFATPGIEAKELYRPLAQVSIQAQLTPSLSVAAQCFLEWQSYLYPEGGTFLGGGDATFYGPDGQYRGPARGAPPGTPGTYIVNEGASRPGDTGEWGVALRWSPAWLDANVGLYYRRFSDKFAAVLVKDHPGGLGPLSPAIGSPLEYRQYYGEGIDLFGVSFAKQLLGASFGADLSYRHDMPLLAQTLGNAVAPSAALAPVLFPHGAPRLIDNTYQARGDTLHAVLNAVGVISRPPGLSTLAWAVEVTYSRWLTVGDNPDMFFGEGYGVCRTDPALVQAGLSKGRSDGCATRDALGIGVGLTPTWLRAFSGVDVLFPMSISWTITGNSPVSFGGNENSGTWGVGVAVDVLNRYRFDLRYADYFGSTQDDGTRVTSINGVLAVLQSRGNVAFTAKATF